jgi:hypothetical protein
MTNKPKIVSLTAPNRTHFYAALFKFYTKLFTRFESCFDLITLCKFLIAIFEICVIEVEGFFIA